MKLNKTMKKILAYVCVVAMVVSSLTFYNNNTASAAITDLPESGQGVVVNVQNFGNGDVLFVAGLDTITNSTSWNLYVDGELWGPVTNGANLQLTSFTSGQHVFCVTGLADGVEIAKSRDITVIIPTHEEVTEPDIIDGTEILQGLSFKDEDTTTDEATSDALWMELGATYTNNGDGSVSAVIPAYEAGENWTTQLKQNKVQLYRGKWYKATYTVTSDVDKSFQCLIQNNTNWTIYGTDTTKVAAGETKTIDIVFQATETTSSVLFGIMMGYVSEPSEAANVTISNVSLKVYNNDPTVGESESDTTPAESTPAETGDVDLSNYYWNLQDDAGTLDTPSEYNGYGFTVSNIDPTKGKWEYGALLDGIAVTKGETYNLTFKVASTVDKVVPIEFTNGTAINRTVNATADGTEFTLKFTANADTVKIYMPLGADADVETIEQTYDVTVSDVQFNITEPDPTEPVTTLPADTEITFSNPTFAFDTSTCTKYYNISWDAVEGAAKYTAYVGVEDEYHIARAFHNNYAFANMGQTNVDHVAGTPGQTETFIVVAYNEEGTLIARGIKEITVPELTEEELAAAAVAAKFNSEDNYAKGATAIVSSGNNANNIVDGNMGSRWQASTAGEDHAVGSEFFGVDLGAVKTIGQVVIAFEASYAAAYDVYVAGQDGVYGETPVASGTATLDNLISTVEFDEVDAQFVKVVVTEFSTNANSYGTSVFELAVLPKEEVQTTEADTTPAPTEPDSSEPTGDKPEAPAGLAHAPGTDGTLPFHFAWAPVKDATSYNVYLNDTFIATVTAPDYNFDETLFATAGDYIIAVTAVKDGVESDKATITYTVEGSETDETDTSKAPAEITMDQELPAPENDNNYTVGGYGIYVGQWNGSTAIAGVDADDADHIKVQQKTSNWVQGGAWGLQVIKKFTGLTAGETYTIEWTIASESTDGKVLITNNDNIEIPLTGGEQTLTGSFTADADGNGEFVVGMGWVGLENPIEYFAPIVKDAEGNVVYPKDEVDPTEPDTSKPDETPTPTEPATTPNATVAPTQATTVAPTTTPKATTKKALGKTTVKKATKKRAANKVKITFRKVTGAKKYTVQISTTKKFKKVLVKKTVKKVKVTITNKKLRNKKKLYVRVRAVGAKKWSKVKRIKIKK